jgi:hypothetical protein
MRRCWRGSRSWSRRRLSKRWWHSFREHQLASVTDLPEHGSQATIKRRVIVLLSVPEAVPSDDQAQHVQQSERVYQKSERAHQSKRTTFAFLR